MGGDVIEASPPAAQGSAATGTIAHIDGYVADTTYPSTFHCKFAPAWTDAILRWHGLAVPRTARGPFTFVDIGCGDGVGLALLAAAHPEGRFIGIDGLAHHAARGREVAAAIGLTNVEFHHSFFADAHHIIPGGADYVMAQGVMSWVRPDHRQHLIELAAAMLRPGGTFTVGYNSLPGWSPILGFQRLVYGLAQTMKGDSSDRFEAAVALMREHKLVDPALIAWMDSKSEILPRNYFAHEYLNRYWAPDWSGDVIAAASERGLNFVGQADPRRHRPDFAYKKAWREALVQIESESARQVAADLYVNSEFRIDIYWKGPPVPVAPEAAWEARLDQVWAATTREVDATYETRTAVGRISFDNEAARTILRTLEAGPAPLRSVEGIGQADLINTIDALQLAALAVPAEPDADTPFAALANEVMVRMTPDAPLAAMAGRNGVFLLPKDAPPVTPELARRYGFADSGGGLMGAGGA